jgi:hypothetical protein
MGYCSAQANIMFFRTSNYVSIRFLFVGFLLAKMTKAI